MTTRGTTLIGHLTTVCTLLFALTACGGGGGDSGFLPPDAPNVPTVLAITTPELPVASAGVEYTALVEAQGGRKPYSWTITNSASTEFKIDSNGFITGKAPEEGAYSLLIEVTDADNSTATLSTILSVTADTDSLAITTIELPVASAGDAYTALVEAQGGRKPYSWTITNSTRTEFKIDSNGFITGIAPAEGDYSLLIQVTDANNSTATLSTILVVTGAGIGSLTITTTELPVASAGADYTALVKAQGGRKPYSWTITNSAKTEFKIDSNGFVTGTAPEKGDYGLIIEVIDASNSGDTLSTILVVTTGEDSLAIATTSLPSAIDGIAYTAVVEAVEGKKPYKWSMIDNGGTGLKINNEGILSGIAPSSGDYGVSLRVTDDTNTQASTSFVLSVKVGDIPEPLTIATTSPLPTAYEGKSYTAILEASGGQGNYLWTLVDAGGSGLELRYDGALTGTAPVEGGYAIAVSVMDDTVVDATALILNVESDSSPLMITTSSVLPPGVLDERYATLLNAAGGTKPYIWRLVSSGGQSLTLSPEGVLEGTPSLAGTFGLVFEVSDGNTTDQLAATLTVTSTPNPISSLTIETPTLPNVKTVLYAATAVATGGKKPYTWSGRDTSTPISGFIINADSGIITGDTTNLRPGLYGYRVTVEDAADAITDRSYIITVPGGDNPDVQILTENPLPDATTGLTYSLVMQAVGGDGTYTWAILETLEDGEVSEDGPSFAPPGSPASGVLFWKVADVGSVVDKWQLTISVTDNSDRADIVVFDLNVVLPSP